MEEIEDSEGGRGTDTPGPGCDALEIAIPVWDDGTLVATTFLTGSTRATPESLDPGPLRCSPCIPSPLLPLAPSAESEVPEDTQCYNDTQKGTDANHS